MPRRRSDDSHASATDESTSVVAQSSSSSAPGRCAVRNKKKHQSKSKSKPRSSSKKNWMTTAAVGMAGLIAAKTLMGMLNSGTPASSHGMPSASSGGAAGSSCPKKPQCKPSGPACARMPHEAAGVHHRSSDRDRSCHDPRRPTCDPSLNRRNRRAKCDMRSCETATTINAPAIITGEDIRNGILLVDTTGVPCVPNPTTVTTCLPTTGGVSPSGNILAQFAPAAEIIDCLNACNGDVFKMLVVVTGNTLPANPAGTPPTPATPTGSFTLTASGGSGVFLHTGNPTITAVQSERLVYVRVTNVSPGMEQVDVYF